MTMPLSPLLSVVVPVYNEEMVIREMHSRLTNVLDSYGIDYEIVWKVIKERLPALKEQIKEMIGEGEI